MKANEIMLNDLIMDENHLVIKVAGIELQGENCILTAYYLRNGQRVSTWENIKGYNPIPFSILTPNIINSIFEQIKGHNVFFSFSNDYRLTAKMKEYEENDIVYVHQLQHFIRKCDIGIELNI